MYQDKNPEIAVRRDAHEKERILPLLNLTSSSRVLDAGCGVGRWCKPVIDAGASYYGTDFSQSLIDTAITTYESYDSAGFQVLSAEKLSFDLIETEQKFTHAIIAGVIMYLNDDDLSQFLSGLATCMAENSRLYIREPVSVSQRLTLKEHWSDDLDSVYSAIYRTHSELLNSFEDALIRNGFTIITEENLFDEDGLNNRKETIQRFYILER